MKLFEILDEGRFYKNIDVVGLNEVSLNPKEESVLNKQVKKISVDPNKDSMRIYVV